MIKIKQKSKRYPTSARERYLAKRAAREQGLPAPTFERPRKVLTFCPIVDPASPSVRAGNAL